MENTANAGQGPKPNNLRTGLLLGALALSVFVGFMAKYYFPS
jgi:hypothetical protein